MEKLKPPAELKLRVVVPDCMYDIAREIYDDCVQVIRHTDTLLPHPRLTELMDKMPVSWARHWCEPGEFGCACLGCENHAGGLLKEGFTKEQWAEYMRSIAPDTEAKP